jgi:hypothetical protein
VRFDAPQGAVTPGQACVFYRGDQVLGGAAIAHSIGTATGSGDARRRAVTPAGEPVRA